MSEQDLDSGTPAEHAVFERRAQEHLQASAEQLDGHTRSRLTQARHAALDAIKQRGSRRAHWLMPAGATAAAAMAVLLSVRSPQHPGEHLAANAAVDEMEIVTAEDSLEFYRDVDFYAWLDTVIDDESAPAENEA